MTKYIANCLATLSATLLIGATSLFIAAIWSADHLAHELSSTGGVLVGAGIMIGLAAAAAYESADKR